MILRTLIFTLLLIAKPLEANVAVDELNALILKKQAPKAVIQKENAEIKDLSSNYYFAFIYRSTCPHCKKFSPILKDFSDTFHIKVRAFSLDNEPLDGFDTTPLTPELFQTFYVEGRYKPTVPALFLVNRHTLEAYAVLFGEATPYQLAKRVHELKQHIEEKFHD
ncbi:TPA: type-F conjugative transfer system pilin assembly thiol-disulfide isomerase TrbB [Legionella anisa]|jgi:type-F conjugative transfer system pilin assembly thiol-disulfide isomerase TrbB|uniref:type-F conjugative transfer system pilin assembly thiol-disulfide isomerase TrbB n=1 Tax=Legionella anisa TaxID=28082 RepID=UPI00197CE403|nr:type-F conjugative transfer system pilin assembly thiol-disulfide isomerase TrbB [Legionella anisa]MBN5937215.1 type-F conjugative transfer system pilin assembly thiol-disulfide isomerase TrbB [Legionella anisa]